MSTNSMFKKATRKQVKLKLGITGPSGSGKTFSALRLAKGLANGGNIAVLDTENDSASLYSDRFSFDVLNIKPPYDHDKFAGGVEMAAKEGYSVVVIDSASHFWEGILEYKSKLDSRPGSNSYTNWNQAGERFKDILKAILQSDIHVILCLRSKMDYVLEQNEKGKTQPRKVGLAPIMRDGVEYEFSTVFDVAMNHEAETSKDRTGMFTDKIFQITEATGKKFLDWLESGEAVAAEPEPDQAQNGFLNETGEPASLDTLKKVTTMLEMLGKTPEQIGKMCKWAGAGGGIDSLSEDQAGKCLHALEVQLEKEGVGA